MEYAKITISPLSPFITPLQSDTLFGHFAWGIFFELGQKRLEELLSNFSDEPFIIFSDGFIKGFLPKPFLKPYLPRDDELRYAKKVKKMQWIDKRFLFDNIEQLSDRKIFDHLKNSEFSFALKQSVTQKNSVNRLSNLVEEGLYTIKENFIKESFEIYFAYQNIKKEEIEQVLDFVAKRGYGKDKSAGKGKFSWKIEWDFDEKPFFTTTRSRYINLSTMFKSSNMHLLYGKTMTKFPKAGGIYAGSRPYKNPVVMYMPGSTFVVGEGYHGRADNRVYNEPNHYHSGYSIGIYYDEVADES